MINKISALKVGGLSICIRMAALLAFAVVMFAGRVGVCDEAQVYITGKKAPAKVSIIVPDFIREGGFKDPEKRDVKMADILADELEGEEGEEEAKE